MREFSRADARPVVIHGFWDPSRIRDLRNQNGDGRLAVGDNLVHDGRSAIVAVLESALGAACDVAPGTESVGFQVSLGGLS